MSKIILGLDIGTQTIKAVQISQDKLTSTLLAAGYIATPTKGLTSESPNDEQVLSNTINRLVHDMKISTADVSACLPSSKVVTRVIEVPIMSDEELTSSIKWEAEQYIPLPLTKVKLDYAIIDKNVELGKMKILMVAAPIAIIEKYMRVITLAGLNPIAFETEILAASRSITASYTEIDNFLVVLMGATTTEIGLLYNRSLVYTKSFPIGGNTLTSAIAQELGFELAQAEEYKKTYGFDEEKLEGKIYKTIFPLFSSIFEEIEKTIIYFKEQYPKEEIKAAVVCGGSAKLPGLILAVTKNIGLDSQVSNPLIKLITDPNILPSLAPDAPMYTVAVGLALKNIE